MATSYVIRNEVDLIELNLGASRTTSRQEAATLQMGLQMQICI